MRGERRRPAAHDTRRTVDTGRSTVPHARRSNGVSGVGTGRKRCQNPRHAERRKTSHHHGRRSRSAREVGPLGRLRRRPHLPRPVRRGARAPQERAARRQDPRLRDQRSRARSSSAIRPASTSCGSTGTSRPTTARENPRRTLQLHPDELRRGARLLPPLHQAGGRGLHQDLPDGRARLLQRRTDRCVPESDDRARASWWSRPAARCRTRSASRTRCTPAGRLRRGRRRHCCQLPNPPVTDLDRQVANRIIPEIEDGACVQIGIGGMPNAVCAVLRTRPEEPQHPTPRCSSTAWWT